jgi:endonuclease YncB( thermonuclease family)
VGERWVAASLSRFVMQKTLVPILLLAAAAACARPAAALATAPCQAQPGSPQCHFWYGKATFIDDGDTLDVDIAGDRSRASRRIRISGIQAMELRRYSTYASRRRGACHAVAAANRLQRLVKLSHGRVRLAAQHPAAANRGRPRRQVSVRLDGVWWDAGAILVGEGLALWNPKRDEWAWNRSYRELSQGARAAGRGLFDPRACGGGGAPLGMRLRFDAPHNDRTHVNGEWARIINPYGRRIRIGGWWFRDSALRRYTFPSRAAIRPHGSLRLRMGRGRGGRRTFHWGLSAPPFENPTHDRVALGDGGYLFDRHGNIRASVIYP